MAIERAVEPFPRLPSRPSVCMPNDYHYAEVMVGLASLLMQ
jgi:hypothetical protein